MRPKDIAGKGRQLCPTTAPPSRCPTRAPEVTGLGLPNLPTLRVFFNSCPTRSEVGEDNNGQLVGPKNMDGNAQKAGALLWAGGVSPAALPRNGPLPARRIQVAPG